MQPQSVGLLKLMLCLVCMSDIQRGDGGGGGAGWRGGGRVAWLLVFFAQSTGMVKMVQGNTLYVGHFIKSMFSIDLHLDIRIQFLSIWHDRHD